jgi:hypothetical protein
LNSYIRKSENLAKISARGSVSRSVMAGKNALNFPATPFHPELLRVEDRRSFGSGCAGLRTDNLAKISERGSVSRSVMAGNGALNFPATPSHPELLRVEDPRSFGSGCAGLRTGH